MIERHGKERVAYWFQLVLAMGIATYGLVLGSTGVVIGAMLVSPLMGPIVEIAMGLVTGSPVLVAYAASRTVASVAVVVLGSTLLTLGLPYHELNPEILARTSPTLIDLYVASFCALAAAYTTVRQSSDTISAAAGTAISIALVPPLCVIGWGFGSARAEVSRGAALLVTANLCAILLFAAIAFFVLAYDTVDVRALEQEAGTGEGLGARLRTTFGSAYGPVLRLSMPLVLIAPVYLPLRHALEEVAWKVRVRDEVARALDGLPAARRAVRSSVNVERSGITIRLVIIGDSAAAAKLKTELTTRVAASAGVPPSVEVVAVAASDAVPAAADVGALPPAPPLPAVPHLRREIDEELRHAWPSSAAGELASWSLVVRTDGATGLQTNHFGAPLGRPGEELLAARLRDGLGVDVSIDDVALSTETVELRAGEEMHWLERLSALVDRASRSGLGHVCVTMPTASKKERRADAGVDLPGSIAAELARIGSERGRIGGGEAFRVRLSPVPCIEADGGSERDLDGDRELDAGADAAGQPQDGTPG